MIAAVDHFAIGQGLQAMLMSDWKIATDRSQYSMPELKNGVACPLGACILENLFGRAQMLEWVIGCANFTAEEALSTKLINEIVAPELLLKTSLERANEFANFPAIPFKLTKEIQNKRFINALNDIREDAANAHVQSFMAKAGQQHFEKILKK